MALVKRVSLYVRVRHKTVQHDAIQMKLEGVRAGAIGIMQTVLFRVTVRQVKVIVRAIVLQVKALVRVTVRPGKAPARLVVRVLVMETTVLADIRDVTLMAPAVVLAMVLIVALAVALVTALIVVLVVAPAMALGELVAATVLRDRVHTAIVTTVNAMAQTVVRVVDASHVSPATRRANRLTPVVIR